MDGLPAVVERGVAVAVNVRRGRRGEACSATRARRTTNGVSVAVRVHTDITANAGKPIALSASGCIWNL